MPDVTISSINIDRPARQRKSIDEIESLAASIKAIGLIHPIILEVRQHSDGDLDNFLVAGERRLEACRSLGWKAIPARFIAEHLAPDVDPEIVELEENIKRKKLPWKEEVAAIAKIHSKNKTADPSWTIKDTAASVNGTNLARISDVLEIAKLLDDEDKVTHQAANIDQARRVVKRKRTRAIDNELASLGDVEAPVRDEEELGSSSDIPGEEGGANGSPPQTSSIIQGDFREWAEKYSGPRFNLIHCDFPYGINHGKSAQGGTNITEAYEDGEEVYWELLNVLTGPFADNFISPSAHLVFWFHMNFYQETLDVLRDFGWTVNPLPLIWHKTDNRGIVADVERRPRHIYETALFASRGDRKIIQPIADCYGAPTHKSQSLHISEKPEPVLRHFFGLCCDNLSRVLDPTCGAGSAIRVADGLGAATVLGIELNPDFAAGAHGELVRAQNLRSAGGILREGGSPGKNPGLALQDLTKEED